MASAVVACSVTSPAVSRPHLSPSIAGSSSSCQRTSGSNRLALKSLFAGDAVHFKESTPSGRRIPTRNSFKVLGSLKDIISNVINKGSEKVVTPTTTITYQGSARISKKRGSIGNIAKFDLVDAGAALQDSTAEVAGKKIEIQLVSEEVDSGSKSAKVSAKSTIEGWLTNTGDLDLVADEDFYSVKFQVPSDFGRPSAFIITNNHPNEFFLKSLSLEAPDSSTIDFPTNAWVYNHSHYPKDRVFFSNKVYLPSNTPAGLVEYRARELEQTRGDGTGQRQAWDRIYDWDVYNDLGDPTSSAAKARPVLGSKEYPYPRRMRTGRPMTTIDPKTESKVSSALDIPYIPSDEYFLRTKNSTFVAVAIKATVHSLLPAISDALDGSSADFKNQQEIKDLYTKGLCVNLNGSAASTTNTSTDEGATVNVIPFVEPDTSGKDSDTNVVTYPLPQVLRVNDTAWETDEEFARQCVAGLHPTTIQLVKSYPPKSTLDPAVYGEGTALTDAHILPYLEGLTVAQAIAAKKLFIIDYHDPFMPFINRVNVDAAGFKAYAPRLILYYGSVGHLMPVAIELSLPPKEAGQTANNQVFTPADEKDFLWSMAKLHFQAIDFNYHEVLTHFTFCHAVMEPFIIATSRQLSELHPLKTLLKPHFKDTLSINSAARAALINAGGVVESYFSMGQYAFQVGSKGYGAYWRFDQLAFPDNLISRGMAERAQDGSIQLVLEDYPWGKDGLDVWGALYEWVSSYVDITYKGSDDAVKNDVEIQAWWKEIVNVGHGDHKDASWWPKADSIESLKKILTTIAWNAGPTHAGVNFGQWAYGGFPLNKPSLMRKLVPERGSDDYKQLQTNTETFFLSVISSSKQATSVMTVLELLSTHSSDEEYIGTRTSANWTSDPEVEAAFRQFSAKVQAIEAKIKMRNKDTALVHRRGPAHVPYTLLYPSSGTGITGQGVPYSVSI